MKHIKPIFLICLFALAGALHSAAQVGNLTNTGNVTVCLHSTESYGVVPTAGSTYSWSILPGSGGEGTLIDGPAPNNLVTVTWTHFGTCTLQVIEHNGECYGNPVTIEVTVAPAMEPGSASGTQSVCHGATPGPLIATEPVGGLGDYRYQWEASTDNGITWNTIAGAEELTYQPPAPAVTTLYRLVQMAGGSGSDNSCSRVVTNTVTVTVSPKIETSPIFHN